MRQAEAPEPNEAGVPTAARRSPEEQQRLDAILTELFEQRICFNETLGLKVQSISPPRLQFEMKRALVGHFMSGRLHGGAIAAVLDSMAGLAVMVAIAEKHADESVLQLQPRFSRISTIDMRVDFLHQGLGTHFVASADVNRLGGRVASAQMKLENQDGLLIATGTAAYMIS